MEQSWRQQAKLGMGSDGENDMLREMLLETKPWVLVVTFIVSILHTVFEFLAFRNNVSDSAWFPNVSELQVASTASSRCRVAATPSS